MKKENMKNKKHNGIIKTNQQRNKTKKYKYII